MATAKEIIVKPISSQDASRIVKRIHYSGKVVNNSQLHFGVFLNGRCEGAMQFGPSLDKSKLQGLVTGTFSKIDEMGAGMYKGKSRVQSIGNDVSGVQPEEGGVNPTCTLQNQSDNAALPKAQAV
jgi:hypothetical protein